VRHKYKGLLHKKTAYEELFGLLQTMPEADSIDVLRRIRAGADVQSTLNLIRDGNLLLQFALAPETRRRYELPYNANMPAFTLVQDNQYLSASIFGTTFDIPGLSSSSQIGQQTFATSGMYSYPYHSAEVVDPLLSQVTASRWTTVTSNDDLLRRLLAAYFMYQHPSHFYFHKDLFLQDMANGRDRFCSSLLVNAVLAAACQSCAQIPNRQKFWEPHNLGYQFTAEAKRLWELESPGKARLTTIHAACLLNMVMDLNGMDKVGKLYYLQGEY
jgi:hypothetical protein